MLLNWWSDNKMIHLRQLTMFDMKDKYMFMLEHFYDNFDDDLLLDVMNLLVK